MPASDNSEGGEEAAADENDAEDKDGIGVKVANDDICGRDDERSTGVDSEDSREAEDV